jgi:arylsulfatase A-like enzyme
MYQHNTRTLNNAVNQGCYDQHWISEIEPTKTYALYMKAAGYATAFYGKYLNQYSGQHVPPGWDEWLGLLGNSRYYNYKLSHNGNITSHGSDYATDYLTDVIKNHSTAWLDAHFESQAISRGAHGPHSTGTSTPALVVIHTPAPHRPGTPAPQYANLYADQKAPRSPSWNAGNDGKHEWLASNPKMDENTQEFSDHVWRRRLRSLRSVDDLIESVFQVVSKHGQLNRSFFIFSSDHGYHSGQWTVPSCKMLPYEETTRIPMYVRTPWHSSKAPDPSSLSSVSSTNDTLSSPSVPSAGRLVTSSTLSIDFAPTLLALAGYTETPSFMDGVSFASKLVPRQYRGRGTAVDAVDAVDAVERGQEQRRVEGAGALDAASSQEGGQEDAFVPRTDFLIEYWSIPGSPGQPADPSRFPTGTDVQKSRNGTDGWCVDNDVKRVDCPVITAVVDSINNTWACLRTLSTAEDSLFCRFFFGYIGRASGVHNFEEYYDMRIDPWQLNNTASTMASATKTRLVQRLKQLMTCGDGNCTAPVNRGAAENGA